MYWNLNLPHSLSSRVLTLTEVLPGLCAGHQSHNTVSITNSSTKNTSISVLFTIPIKHFITSWLFNHNVQTLFSMTESIQFKNTSNRAGTKCSALGLMLRRGVDGGERILSKTKTKCFAYWLLPVSVEAWLSIKSSQFKLPDWAGRDQLSSEKAATPGLLSEHVSLHELVGSKSSYPSNT